MTFIRKSIALAVATASLAAVPAAMAQDAAAGYPNRPVTLVVGFPPGTATDSVARVLAERFAARLGQPFIIENRPGQGGSIGAAVVAKAKPDGYTLVVSATAPMSINPYVYKNLTYEPMRDFAPIGLHTWLPYSLVVNTKSSINSFEDLKSKAAANPGALTFASIGNGTTSHLVMALLMQRTGMKLTHVPYKGSSQAQTDLIGGQVDMTFDTVVSMMPHIKSGKLKPLAVSTMKRSSHLPEVRTLNEMGVPNFEVGAWLGMLAPAGTPPAIIAKLNRELNAILDEPAPQQKLLGMGSEILKSTPEEFTAHIKAENERWSKLVRDTGTKID
ncbi:Bug family tripartite tricarboxylate transporter substrate binding protein [Lacisediminimonas profundi]|uniref:Bug family tripartite tricarboxylate transporter substrate binding protein n=1 Tax=Lacisediminimonas profundi TaxID=2603856 RepID=UPI00124B1D74|nr:tripartite tricarboxylate transporter substrate binding protein [Lacisediminimonas profundi]